MALYGFNARAAADTGTIHDVELAIELVGRLKHEPMSTFRADQAGTEDVIGWTPAVAALAAIYDALAAQAKGKKLKDSEKYPRPKIRKTSEFRPKSVAELDWHQVMGGLRG